MFSIITFMRRIHVSHVIHLMSWKYRASGGGKTPRSRLSYWSNSSVLALPRSSCYSTYLQISTCYKSGFKLIVAFPLQLITRE